MVGGRLRKSYTSLFKIRFSYLKTMCYHIVEMMPRPMIHAVAALDDVVFVALMLGASQSSTSMYESKYKLSARIVSSCPVWRHSTIVIKRSRMNERTLQRSSPPGMVCLGSPVHTGQYIAQVRYRNRCDSRVCNLESPNSAIYCSQVDFYEVDACGIVQCPIPRLSTSPNTVRYIRCRIDDEG